MSCILVEGVDGVGKSAVFNALSSLLPLCETVKLSGGPAGCGPDYQREKFQFWADYVPLARHNTLLFDRGPTSERVYGPFKGYSANDLAYLDDVEQRLTDAGCHLVLLVATRKVLAERLAMKQVGNPNERHVDANLAHQLQHTYLDVLHTSNRIRPYHVVDTTLRSVEQTAQEVLRIVRPQLHTRGVGL